MPELSRCATETWSNAISILPFPVDDSRVGNPQATGSAEGLPLPPAPVNTPSHTKTPVGIGICVT
jgi:hypothetical protein